MPHSLHTLLCDTLAGHRLTEEEAVQLFTTRGRDIWKIAAAADELREERAGDAVTYVRNQNIHVTNICKNLCGFCGFGRRADDPGAFYDDPATVREKARTARERNVTEICLLSGVHPDYTLDSYADLISSVREAAPGVDIHTASPDEIVWAAAQSGTSTVAAIERLREAGLGTLQGTAAEILVDSVRRIICPRKCDTATWVRVIREAHHLGIRSTATIMYGHCESDADRARHLGILREIQDETHGFTEFIPLSFIHENTALYRAGLARAGATGREDILMVAVARLFLDNFDHVQVSWGKVGTKMAEAALLAGADDLGGTMFCDDVSTDAGSEGADYLDPRDMQRIAQDIGRTLRQRTTTYGAV
ncbi:MAG TPA: 5-amino-6-(D-ribitylamino)uracil--L-tyrosine 4-hydroxyphenyl transferase CofH [Methanoculleus sp.]|jgi:FO synthase subunit 2|uniref:5-amino-6-(D-ribitylamino)uracil--L-tyrosine 4-hydroxyphenyl transferase CofH n=1 Tax=Methanoculleus sp. TaxID=90427 RepID=UPI000A5DBD5C|nr:5-amino-6-(D-ribitylamino)uracil--L-tyrosine 4-hydroxyphenyl transferase CofH [Methanoculleus sp.]MBP7144890.1 5-amino-6-(D-ribitylamino)uracil--L-tyrosine 4-hydroxyphenyl transferase CofH [Methanoculleus sp.]HNT07625.1 5-amino-6-(D-ribitylamino)uracil--L-tyrosine 4-hydroxyphenyl transferase CofH [Methanoculleus sp.]HOF96916.1 5-amino-6-(D-ribitylamino)uracil--L-tyrosine 4-hydroxyphenyl transferase CofH [Methanoculleus sp.]HOS68435.1 5-amino-6-(D-ribitylamino)uracil--L-tyrosine 4-hydroxyphen